VNLDYVDRILGLDGARLEVIMNDGEFVPVSRAGLGKYADCLVDNTAGQSCCAAVSQLGG
jgi:hypothetical protein